MSQHSSRHSAPSALVGCVQGCDSVEAVEQSLRKRHKLGVIQQSATRTRGEQCQRGFTARCVGLVGRETTAQQPTHSCLMFGVLAKKPASNVEIFWIDMSLGQRGHDTGQLEQHNSPATVWSSSTKQARTLAAGWACSGTSPLAASLAQKLRGKSSN